MQPNLRSLPDPPKEYVIDFPRLDGGLNTWELDYRLDADESPEMKNLWWKDGVLCGRDGQVRLTTQEYGTGYSAYERLFWDWFFFHVGDKLLCGKIEKAEDGTESFRIAELTAGVPENRGSWFRYGDSLYYKNRGGYYCIEYKYDEENKGWFSTKPVAAAAFEPVILINTEPTTAAGDQYQPENRLSPVKTVWYSTVEGIKEYHLPVQEVDSVDKVIVDDEELNAETDYTVDLNKGIVTFTTEPKHHNPVVVNSVKITYTKQNPDAFNSIMDCPYAIPYGGNQNISVVMGGSTAQPNAYFWCGNHTKMDPSYFPMTQYNLAGATEEPITGFGKQQNMLVIFKERSVGRSSMSTTEMASGRVLLSMDYVSINSEVGCDIPWSIRLVNNNLVFASKQKGVQFISDSSAAYENNITGISRKVDNGMLHTLRKAKVITSFDDGDRYWLVADGEVYAWDYSLSTPSDPSWFYFDNIAAADFIMSDADAKYHLGTDGSITVFRRVFTDYGEGIDKKYRFATQNMGSYDRLKNITNVLLTVRGDTDTKVDIEYKTDFGVRKDLTGISSYSWRLAPRNLAHRCLALVPFATTARRKPMCRRVRHFTMTLSNSEKGMDMSILSAQIFYNFQGRER